MFVLIDMQRMLVLHKHRDRAVLANLAHIEGVGVVTRLGPADDKCTLHDLTLLELQMLYHHTTGEKLAGYWLASAANAVMAVLERLPESDVDPVEVAQQAFEVPWKSVSHYKYVKGSNKPTIPVGLFLPEGMKTTAVPDDQALATKYVKPAEPPAYIPPPPPAPKPPRAARSAPASGVKVPRGAQGSGPAPGTLTARIYARCQEQYDMNKRECNAQVDADSIRKVVAKILIEEGVNPSTARRQTMEWMNSLQQTI
jgi:hypothetical protein